MSAAELRAFAPRLCRAWEQAQERAAFARQQRPRVRDDLLRAEACLAHRELQIIRAGARSRARGGRSGQASYIHERQRKLEASHREVERKRQKLAAMDSALKEAAV